MSSRIVPSPLHQEDGYLQGLHRLETALSLSLASDGGHILLGPNLPLTLFMRTDGTMELKRIPLCERIAPQLPPLASPFTALMWGDGLAGIKGNTLKDGRSRALIVFHGLLQHFLDPGLFRYALPFNASGYGTSSAQAVKRHAHLILKLLSMDGGAEGSIWPTVVRLAEQVVNGEEHAAAGSTPHLMISSLRQYFSSSLSPSLAGSFAMGCSDLLQHLAGDDHQDDQGAVCEKVLRDIDAYVTFDDQGAGSDVRVCDAFSVSFRDCHSGVQIDPPEDSQPPHHHFVILRVSRGGWCGVDASDDSSSDDDDDDDEGGGVDRMAVVGDLQLHDKEAQYKRFIQTLAVIAKCGVRAVLTSAKLPDWWSPPAVGSKAVDGRASSSTVSLTLPTRDGPLTYNMDVVHSLDRGDLRTIGRRLCGGGASRFDTLDVYPGMTNQEVGEALLQPIGSVFRRVPFVSMSSTGHRHGADQQYLSIKGARIPQAGDAPLQPPLQFLRIPVASCKLIRTWRLTLLGGFAAALSNLQEGFVAGGGWHPAALSHALKAEVRVVREGIAESPSQLPTSGAHHLLIERCEMLSVLSDVLLHIPVNLCPSAALKRELVKRYTSCGSDAVCGVLYQPNGDERKGADASITTAGYILEAGIVEAGGDLLNILRTVLGGLSAIMHIDGVFQV